MVIGIAVFEVGLRPYVLGLDILCLADELLTQVGTFGRNEIPEDKKTC